MPRQHIRTYWTFEKAREFVRSLQLNNVREWKDYCSGKLEKEKGLRPKEIPSAPDMIYSRPYEEGEWWKSWSDFLGSKETRQKIYESKYLSYEAASNLVKKKNIKTKKEYRNFKKQHPESTKELPPTPPYTYKSSGWTTWANFLQTGKIHPKNIEYMSLEEAKKFVYKLKINTYEMWIEYCKGNLPNLPEKPINIPRQLHIVYKNKGWCGYKNFFGTDFLSFPEARDIVRKLNLKSVKDWKSYIKIKENKEYLNKMRIPLYPKKIYRDVGWSGIIDWIKENKIIYQISYDEAQKIVCNLNIKSREEWILYIKNDSNKIKLRELKIPIHPHLYYRNAGWRGWTHWLGIKFLEYDEAQKIACSLNIEGWQDWLLYIRDDSNRKKLRKLNIPLNPQIYYSNKGWQNFNHWLGKTFLEYDDARNIVNSFNLGSWSEWLLHIGDDSNKKKLRGLNVPLNPHIYYQNKGWQTWNHWLGITYLEYNDAKKIARNLKIKNRKEWICYIKDDSNRKKLRELHIPLSPHIYFRDNGWQGWKQWLEKPNLEYDEAKNIVCSLNIGSREEWHSYISDDANRKKLGELKIPSNPFSHYRNLGWQGWNHWLGITYLEYDEAKNIVCSLDIGSSEEWLLYIKDDMNQKKLRELKVPTNPNRYYLNNGWQDWNHWLGITYIEYDEARKIVSNLNIKSGKEWLSYIKDYSNQKKLRELKVPLYPHKHYRSTIWKGWNHWFGIEYLDFDDAKNIVNSFNIGTQEEWIIYIEDYSNQKKLKELKIPLNPHKHYRNIGWRGWKFWLEQTYLKYDQARKIVCSLDICDSKEWMLYIEDDSNMSKLKELKIPLRPHIYYKNSGWRGWKNWLDTSYLSYDDAKKIVSNLNIVSRKEWMLYIKDDNNQNKLREFKIPLNPFAYYRDKGWQGWNHWFGLTYLKYDDAKKFVKSLRLKSRMEWKYFCKIEINRNYLKKKRIPLTPEIIFNNNGWLSWEDFLGVI